MDHASEIAAQTMTAAANLAGGVNTRPHNPYYDSPAKETVISMVISLAMALVAKSFIVEAFVIPTGSMAPTLLGQHMLFKSPQSGYDWTVNPFYFQDDRGQFPFGVQGNGNTFPYPTSTDPMSTSQVNGWDGGRVHRVRAGYAPVPGPMRARAGDRILVHKWLYEVFEPQRFDVVVFKNPEDPGLNYIKRLIGLPNEDVWLADGDVFVRPHTGDGTPDTTKPWTIQRKSDRVQSSLWRTVFSSEYTPEVGKQTLSGVKVFESPWTGAGWDVASQTYSTKEESSSLSWDTGKWPIWDWVAYNDMRDNSRRDKWPVSDLRVRAGIRPEKAGLSLAATISARRHEFQGAIENGKAVLRMRPTVDGVALGASGSAETWTTLGEAALPSDAFTPGAFTDFELWHADQRLEVRVNGVALVTHEYDWHAEQRVLYVTGAENPNNTMGIARLGNPLVYEDGKVGTAAAKLPAVSWTFSGSAVTLARVGLDKDVYYEPAARNGRPFLATTDARPASLGKDQFFCCGDNSSNSFDGRMWGDPNPWVAAEIDDTPGIVHRKMLLGKAFFVYFPAPYMIGERVPVPDFGRMRFIR